MKEEELNQETRDFYLHLQRLCHYWSDAKIVQRETTLERMQGLVHSILCLFDGVSGSDPGCGYKLVKLNYDETGTEAVEGEEIGAGMLHDYWSLYR